VAATIHLRSKNSWVKQAIGELDDIQQGEESRAAQRTAELLKRVVITHDKGKEVKHLSGEDWIHYLDSFFSTRFFTEGDGRIFGFDLYRPNHNLKPDIYKSIKKLIRNKSRAQ